ncbi:hypothetical protein GMST_28940 [Geomonas silvestris]|uniref:histidine kinase n=1 Tax=Geomonas silvestris TaxID=2740184 RepID=A0A6V8MLR4_9BACT|nr:PAS domain-containing sensor histidine kinase [Geomonas silvestris]GFO60569.1 hypothetical protein GMST_28940 [Geomonas silvestris]
MTPLKMNNLSFPSPVQTIALLLGVLFVIETTIMYLLPWLVPIKNPYLENLLDATLLTALFTPMLYRRVFQPFRRVAAMQKTLTDRILAGVVDGVIIFDEAGKVQAFNRAAEELFGYSAEELPGGKLRALLDPVQFEAVIKAGTAPRPGKGAATLEIKGRHRGGAPLSLEVSLSQVDWEENRMWLAIIRDISARKEGEAQMKQALSLLNATLESTADGIIVRDLAGRSVIANRRFAEMWGMPEEILADGDERSMRDYVLDQLKDPHHFLEITERQRKDPQRESTDILAFRDGRVFERVATPQVVEGNIVGRVINFRDITEQKNLEHQLRHAQKMEALGTLAGGVAHDFNNILTVIMGYCNLTSQQLESDTPLRQNLNQIMAASERAASLTNSLLAYSRKQAITPRPLDLNQCVLKVEKFLARLIGEQIELVARLTPDKITVFADSTQLEQVLMNLAANARDAMDRRGCLIISTGRIRIDQEFVRLHGYGKPGDFAVLSVSDTGAGMSEVVREKIFEPFFTTKEMGHGTGLGLSIVYGIVKQHNGYINVYSESGHGTTFNIYLPVCGEPEAAPAPDSEPIAGGSETILLAEDDQSVRSLVRSVLTAQGYRVLEAADGAEALALFREHEQEIDLLILDVVMPKLNGKETFSEICARKPGSKAIFISGYTADIMDKNGLADQGLHLVNKPLLPSQLLSKVREVLQTG